jgi:predicted metal-dependent peptidase
MSGSMDKYQKALIHLLGGDGVFYASLIMQMRIVDGKDLPKDALAAVSVSNGRIHLHIDPVRFEKFSVEQVSRILEHECLHLVLEHLGRMENRHPYIWNLATDLAVNSLIPHMDMGLICGKEPFSDFVAKKSADFYYAILKDKFHIHEVTINPDGTVTVKDKKTGKSVTVKPTGDHKDWEKTTGSAADGLTKEVIKQAVAEAHAQAKAAGKWPAGIKELIEDLLGKEQVNWKKLLRQYIGNRVKAGSKHSWKRESKRFGTLQKGKLKHRIIKIAVGIDTSGSISNEDLQEFMTEIHGIMNSYKTDITIVECDAKVGKVYTLRKYMKVDPKFTGRGGTDLREIFNYFDGEGRAKKPEMLVCFTDLETPFPEKETLKTLWVRTSNGYQDKVPFGKLIIIPREDRKKRGEDAW